MLIIFISFALLALVVSSNNYMVTLESKREVVDRAAKSVSKMVTEIYHPSDADEFSGVISHPREPIPDYLEHLASFSEDLRIIVFDSSGRLLICSRILIL